VPQQIDIAAQLDVLIKLQGLDTQIYALRREKEKKPQELAAFEAEFKEKDAGLKKAEADFTVLQLKRKEKEGALSGKEEQVKKLQSQLSQLKTNKEYSAMQHEINAHKVDKSLIEDVILTLMDDIDKAKIKIEKEKELLSQEEVKLNQQQKLVKAQLEEIEKKLQQLEIGRQVITPQVDPSTLKKYEKILRSKNGLAIVGIGSNACQGCNMNLPPQVINQVHLKKEFIICESCTRFLYTNESAE